MYCCSDDYQVTSFLDISFFAFFFRFLPRHAGPGVSWGDGSRVVVGAGRRAQKLIGQKTSFSEPGRLPTDK